MKKVFGLALSILLLGFMSACSNEESVKEQATPAATEQAEEEESAPVAESEEETTSAVAGNEVFQESCITCHSSGDISGGQSMLNGAKIQTNYQKQEDLLAFVSEKMPKQAPGSLSQEEYEAVVKYLWEQN